MTKRLRTAAISLAWAALAGAQTPGVPAAPRRVAPPRVIAPSYPQRPEADPAALDRGKALYGAQCNFCHGSDARGGEGGPNLLRSELVLNDKNGEAVAPVILNGRPDQGMPKFPMTMAQIADVAAYIHNFPVGGYDVSRMVPLSILVGDAKAGQSVFGSKCASCHSVAGDLKGIGAKIPDAKVLQDTFLFPGGGRRGPGGPVNVAPTTVTVTPESVPKVEGRLARLDDFIVSLVEADGTPRTFRRDGDNPKVEVHDPLAPHIALLPTYTDKEIHDLTSYLVTVK